MFIKNCRICLSDQGNNISLFSMDSSDNKCPSKTGQMYMDCLRLELNDNPDHPDCICNCCKVQLTAFYTFMVMAKRSFEKFTTDGQQVLGFQVKDYEAHETVQERGQNIRTVENTEDEMNNKRTEWVIQYTTQNNVISADKQSGIIEADDNASDVHHNIVFQQDVLEATPSVYTCKNCNSMYSTSDKFKDHLKYHPDCRMICELYDKKLHKLQLYQADMNGGPQVELCGIFKCEICDDVFSFESNYHEHIMLIHLNRFSHKCNVCDKHFRSESLLAGHRKSHCYRANECKICGIHIEYGLECDICNRRLSQLFCHLKS